MKGFQLKILFSIIVVVLLLISLVTYRNLNNIIGQVTSVRHSNKVILSAQAALSSVKDAETGHRGFQLTRDTLYLKPYYSAVSELPQVLKSLDSLVSNDEVQNKNIDTLNALINNQFLIIASILTNAERTTLYMDEYEQKILLRGKINMDKIRRVGKDIIEIENKAVKQKLANESNYKNIAPVVLLIYTLVALVAMAFLFSRILQNLELREAAEQKLRDNVSELEIQKSLITERKIILNEAESLSNMGSWKWTEKNDELIWSEGLYKIFNKNSDEDISWDTFLENVFPEDQLLVEDFLNEVKTRKSGGMIDYRIKKEDNLRYLSLTVKPHAILNIDILGAVVDITERKESERKLKQFNAELTRSNEDLEQFAYVASHDLQEPLRKIRAFGDRLAVKYTDLLGDQGKDYVLRMQSAAARMQTLIEDLLSFSRVSRVQADYEFLDMRALLKEVMEDIDTLIKRENATVRIGQVPAVYGDSAQIKRLFQNLISNAIKFHKQDVPPVVDIQGKIMKESEILNELGVQLPNAEYVRISIKDNGIGFNIEYVEKIFNIFQRLHGRTAYEGTGIGLAICRKIVNNHNGYITAKSIENIGSDFIVIFRLNLKSS